MRWYEGDIEEAVTTSKANDAVFVVYVEGTCEKSNAITSLIDEQVIRDELESKSFVAIKIKAGSVSYEQFRAIYKIVPVPSLFFIGRNGRALDVVTEAESSSGLSSRISSVMRTHSASRSNISLTGSNSTVNASANLIQSEQQSTSTSNKPVELPSNNGTCAPVMDSKSGTDLAETKSLTSEEEAVLKEQKLQRAKELIEQKRVVKQAIEEELLRAKEIERRRMGQDVQKMRRTQQDQELKNLMDERQRARNEEKAARDRILAQIEQDKADRALKFGASPSPPAAAPVPQEPVVERTTRPTDADYTHLQFRLPNGDQMTQYFKSTTRLEEVRQYILETLTLPFREFSLATTFPRREFTAHDNGQTLHDLELCPTAVLLILQSHASTVASGSTGIASLFWLLLSPIVGIFGFIRNLIFRQQPPANRDPDTSAQDRPKGPKPAPVPEQQPTQSDLIPSKRKSTDSTVIRRQGNSNIHRLRDRTDSDEDNNTWNGNSTQQM